MLDLRIQPVRHVLLLLGVLLLSATSTASATQSAAPANAEAAPTQWMALLAAMAVLPLLLTMITPFAKLVIVGSMLRQALGTQNSPPTVVITGLALILTVGIVRPVADEILGGYQAARKTAPADEAEHETLARVAHAPIARFLTNNADEENRRLFKRLQEEVRERHSEKLTTAGVAQPTQPELSEEAAQGMEILTELAPAFMLTELTEAFWIVAIIFIPLLVIDLVIGNILLAMGMQMMVPSTISLPVKIIAFVLAGGWEILFQALVVSYA
jgi:type III secretion protein R